MNFNIIVLMQIFCIVLANPVKRDGANFQPSISDFIPLYEFPITVIRLPDSSESISEEPSEIPVEFPYHLAKSIDEFLSLNPIKENTEKPIDDDTATCPNTDIILNAEETTTKTAIQKKRFGSGMEKISRHRKSLEDSDESVSEKSEPSASMSGEKAQLSVAKMEEKVKIINDFMNIKNKIEKIKNLQKNLENNKAILQNEIAKDSKENLKSKFYEEAFVVKKVDGKPIQGTLTIEKVNGDEVKKIELNGKENGTEKEKEDLEMIGQAEENFMPFNSRIIDVLSSPFGIHFG